MYLCDRFGKELRNYEGEVGKYNRRFAGKCGSKALCTAYPRKRRMGGCVPKAGVEQEDKTKESKSAACEGVWRADCDMQGDTP